jgi:hypothetical protein
VADSIEQLSYELSLQALGEQERSVAGIRTRAGTVLAAASIAGSFLGSRTAGKRLPDWSLFGAHVGHGSLDVWSFLAILAFGLTAASSVWILLPRRLSFAFDAETLLTESDQFGGVPVVEGYRALTLWLVPYVNRNRRAIERLNDLLIASCILLGVEILLWSISLA